MVPCAALRRRYPLSHAICRWVPRQSCLLTDPVSKNLAERLFTMPRPHCRRVSVECIINAGPRCPRIVTALMMSALLFVLRIKPWKLQGERIHRTARPHTRTHIPGRCMMATDCFRRSLRWTRRRVSESDSASWPGRRLLPRFSPPATAAATKPTQSEACAAQARDRTSGAGRARNRRTEICVGALSPSIAEPCSSPRARSRMACERVLQCLATTDVRESAPRGHGNGLLQRRPALTSGGQSSHGGGCSELRVSTKVRVIAK